MKICEHCKKIIKRNFNKHKIKCSFKKKSIDFKKMKKNRQFTSNTNIPKPNAEVIAEQYKKWLKRNEKKTNNSKRVVKSKFDSDISINKSIWTVRK